ncbi:MAG: hypothetical protein EOO04_37550 [Chitinophagaceae bacterium]|nr:MAG: hypothetical protein EOO04_37550 [Chitinophagaceae bacterium]
MLTSAGVKVVLKPFRFLPSYDIDIAYSYKFKGIRRTVGALGKDLLSANSKAVLSRFKVLAGSQRDPYDCFDFLKSLHRSNNLRALYFMLLARETGKFDKNNSPEHPAMHQLTNFLSNDGAVGIHPSYFSNIVSVLHWEKKKLEGMLRKPVRQSRQHYIRMRLPDTYSALLAAGINEDYSMGFGSCLGFRAGTGRSFLWYDLENETITALRIHPFCFMDSTARFEEGLTVDEAFAKLYTMLQLLAAHNSVLTTVFHNFSLGTDPEWEGWSERYRDFVNYCGTITS